MTLWPGVSCLILLAGSLPSFAQPPAEVPAPAVQAAPRPEDETAIRELFEQFTEAWNAADADRLSELFVPERGHVRSTRETFQGRARVRGFFAEVLDRKSVV